MGYIIFTVVAANGLGGNLFDLVKGIELQLVVYLLRKKLDKTEFSSGHLAIPSYSGIRIYYSTVYLNKWCIYNFDQSFNSSEYY